VVAIKAATPLSHRRLDADTAAVSHYAQRMLAACIAAIGLFGVAAVPAAASSGFVEADRTRFALDGRPWRPIGYNQYRLTSQPGGYVCDPGYGAISDASLGRRLDEMRDAGANTVRTWFFQSYYQGGGWAPFDRVLRAAAARGLRVIPTLVNHYPDCEPPSGGAKSTGFYETAFRSPGYGYSLSFKEYARMVAEHYAADRTVAFWQLVNEAEACGSGGPAALRSFAGEMRAQLRAVDPSHLVSLGTIGANQCGTTGDDYRTVNEAVDVCEVHDYGAPQAAMPGDATNGIARRIRQCTDLGKPIFVGEAGIQSDVDANGGSSGTTTAATLRRRAEFFAAKIAAQLRAGMDGYLMWDKILENSDSPFNASSGRFGIGRFGIGTTEDPVAVVMRAASTAPAAPITQPLPPPPGAPEAAAGVTLRIGRGTAGRIRAGSDGTVRLRRPRVDCRGPGAACVVTTVVRAVLVPGRTSIAGRAVMPIAAGLVGRLHVDLGAASRRHIARRALPGTLRVVVSRGTVRRAKTVRITILPPRRPFRT